MDYTVGPWLSGYLYYPAAILTYIMSIFNSLAYKILHRTKTEWFNFCLFNSISNNLSQWVNTLCIYPVLKLLCKGRTPISGQIAYPDRCWSRCGRITEVGLTSLFVDEQLAYLTWGWLKYTTGQKLSKYMILNCVFFTYHRIFLVQIHFNVILGKSFKNLGACIPFSNSHGARILLVVCMAHEGRLAGRRHRGGSQRRSKLPLDHPLFRPFPASYFSRRLRGTPRQIQWIADSRTLCRWRTWRRFPCHLADGIAKMNVWTEEQISGGYRRGHHSCAHQ